MSTSIALLRKSLQIARQDRAEKLEVVCSSRLGHDWTIKQAAFETADAEVEALERDLTTAEKMARLAASGGEAMYGLGAVAEEFSLLSMSGMERGMDWFRQAAVVQNVLTADLVGESLVDNLGKALDTVGRAPSPSGSYRSYGRDDRYSGSSRPDEDRYYDLASPRDGFLGSIDSDPLAGIVKEDHDRDEGSSPASDARSYDSTCPENRSVYGSDDGEAIERKNVAMAYNNFLAASDCFYAYQESVDLAYRRCEANLDTFADYKGAIQTYQEHYLTVRQAYIGYSEVVTAYKESFRIERREREVEDTATQSLDEMYANCNLRHKQYLALEKQVQAREETLTQIRAMYIDFINNRDVFNTYQYTVDLAYDRCIENIDDAMAFADYESMIRSYMDEYRKCHQIYTNYVKKVETYKGKFSLARDDQQNINAALQFIENMYGNSQLRHEGYMDLQQKIQNRKQYLEKVARQLEVKRGARVAAEKKVITGQTDRPSGPLLTFAAACIGLRVQRYSMKGVIVGKFIKGQYDQHLRFYNYPTIIFRWDHSSYNDLVELETDGTFKSPYDNCYILPEPCLSVKDPLLVRK